MLATRSTRPICADASTWRSLAPARGPLSSTIREPTGTQRSRSSSSCGNTWRRDAVTMTAKPVVLLWLNETGPYREALADAGLADRVELHALRMDEAPSPDLMIR